MARRRRGCRRTCSARCSSTSPRSLARKSRPDRPARSARGVYPHRVRPGIVRGAERRARPRPGRGAGRGRGVHAPGPRRTLAWCSRSWPRTGSSARSPAWQRMLSSRLYLGEIHFGELHNLRAHGRSSGAVACSIGCSGVGVARPTGQVRPAARPPGRAAVRHVRVKDGDQHLHRQLPVRNTSATGARDGRRSRPTSSSRWC